MSGFSDWSEADIRTVYSTTMYSEMPCPTDLFLSIIEISRLRASIVALTPCYYDAIRPAISSIFERIAAFVPERWTEPYTVPDKPEMALIICHPVVAVASRFIPQEIGPDDNEEDFCE
jgi:hypothetical protein